MIAPVDLPPHHHQSTIVSGKKTLALSREQAGEGRRPTVAVAYSASQHQVGDCRKKERKKERKEMHSNI